MKKWFVLASIISFSLISAAFFAKLKPDEKVQPAPASAEAGSYRTGDRLEPPPRKTDGSLLELGWADLVPSDWITDEFLNSLNLDELDDDDPRAEAALQKILAEWNRAPVVEELDDRRVRIPGFVVPLEGDGRTIQEFLLVPYFGACVHVPPPPSNQLIHILPDRSIPGEWDMQPVWVTGRLRVTRFESDLGNAGYQLQASEVEEYQEPAE